MGWAVGGEALSEAQTWKTLKQLIAPLDPYRVENLVDAGCPDVNYTGGWIELKNVPKWPKRPNTLVRIDHYTDQQRLWLLRRWKAGGRAFLVVQVDRSWFLFGAHSAQLVGYITREQMIASCLCWWQGKPVAEQLITWLTVRWETLEHLDTTP